MESTPSIKTKVTRDSNRENRGEEKEGNIRRKVMEESAGTRCEVMDMVIMTKEHGRCLKRSTYQQDPCQNSNITSC